MSTELPTVLYLCDLLNIANWNKLKKQLAIKYGEAAGFYNMGSSSLARRVV